MTTQLTPLSASVTRILSLSGFSKDLKTKDIQSAFSEWENMLGGFRIKWVDDTSLMMVFADATVGTMFLPSPSITSLIVSSSNRLSPLPFIAKRAYLHTLLTPPPAIFDSEPVATIKPYDGPDAQSIIQSVNQRHNHNASRAHNRAQSVAVGGSHNRLASISQRNGVGKGLNGINVDLSLNGVGSSAREPSPTLPSIPAQPTLNALIQQSAPSFGDDSILNDPAIIATSADVQQGGAPRIGDPGKRMLGAALGVRYHGSTSRSLSGGVTVGGGAHAGGANSHLMDMQKAMDGLMVAE